MTKKNKSALIHINILGIPGKPILGNAIHSGILCENLRQFELVWFDRFIYRYSYRSCIRILPIWLKMCKQIYVVYNFFFAPYPMPVINYVRVQKIPRTWFICYTDAACIYKIITKMNEKKNKYIYVKFNLLFMICVLLLFLSKHLHWQLIYYLLV